MRVLALALLVVAGCGPVADPAMAGTWVGTTLMTVGQGQPAAIPGGIQVVTSGADVTVGRICFDGSGEMVAEAVASSRAEWRGSHACPPISFTDCAAVVLIYETATLELGSDGVMEAATTGTATGCGTQAPVTLAFTGTRG